MSSDLLYLLEKCKRKLFINVMYILQIRHSLKYFVGAVKGVLFKNLYKLQLYCNLVVLPTEAFAWNDQMWAGETVPF